MLHRTPQGGGTATWVVDKAEGRHEHSRQLHACRVRHVVSNEADMLLTGGYTAPWLVDKVKIGHERSSQLGACRMQHVVFDEADMLLTGGFEAPTRYLLTLLKEADRASMVATICADLGITEDEFRSLPLLMRRTGLKGEPQQVLHWVPAIRHLCSAHKAGRAASHAFDSCTMFVTLQCCPGMLQHHGACAAFACMTGCMPCHCARQVSHSNAAGGAAAMQAAGYTPAAVRRRKALALAEPEDIWQQPGTSSAGRPAESSVPALQQQQPEQLQLQQAERTASSSVGLASTSGRDGVSEPEPYWRRQYVFCAATMPAGDGAKQKSVAKVCLASQ